MFIHICDTACTCSALVIYWGFITLDKEIKFDLFTMQGILEVDFGVCHSNNKLVSRIHTNIVLVGIVAYAWAISYVCRILV